MNKILISIFIICLNSSLITSNAINWQGDWAMNCDFVGKDLKHERTTGAQCSSTCKSTTGCTHFSWTKTDGICWMKTGGASKSEASWSAASGSVCGVVNGVSTGGSSTGGSSTDGSIKFNTINNCAYPVWVGMQGQSKSNSNWKLPNNGGWKLNANERKTVSVPFDFFAGRFWPRTGCKMVNGQFRCETGDCGSSVQCAHDGVQRGGQPPVSLAEFTLESWHDYYDVSLVDGFNIQIQIRPTNQNAPAKSDPYYWCAAPKCNQDLNSICPEELKVRNSQSQVVACNSACNEFRTDEYCCHGNFNRPETCKASHWPKNYPAIYKQACPDAYSYAYDDHSSTYFCTKTDYDIIFC